MIRVTIIPPRFIFARKTLIIQTNIIIVKIGEPHPDKKSIFSILVQILFIAASRVAPVKEEQIKLARSFIHFNNNIGRTENPDSAAKPINEFLNVAIILGEPLFSLQSIAHSAKAKPMPKTKNILPTIEINHRKLVIALLSKSEVVKSLFIAIISVANEARAETIG